MIELKRNGTNWQVVKDGEIVKSGLTMLEARSLYAELMGVALEGRARKRRVFR